MTSLDDSLITRKNLLLLDNVTNYARPAIDYFTYEFGEQHMATTWNLLRKMRNHKLLRLPSCSFENDFDYYLYLTRLGHTIWRRWYQQLHDTDKRINPLSVDWDRDLDVTVLYGPDLTGKESDEWEENEEKKSMEINDTCHREMKSSGIYCDDDGAGVYSCSSGRSSVSSIFDQTSKHLRFSETVLRRDIDPMGIYHESHILIKRFEEYAPYEDYAPYEEYAPYEK